MQLSHYLLRVIGPASKNHLAGLFVKGEVADVHGARALENRARDPEHVRESPGPNQYLRKEGAISHDYVWQITRLRCT